MPLKQSLTLSVKRRPRTPALTSAPIKTCLPNPDSWRAEVAARLERYRTRRKPRTATVSVVALTVRCARGLVASCAADWFSPSGIARGSSTAVAAAAGQEVAFQTEEEPEPLEPTGSPNRSHRCREIHSAMRSRIRINMRNPPRSSSFRVLLQFQSFAPANWPIPSSNRPRIVEAPEILPPPPALGGMLIEPAHKELARGAYRLCFAIRSRIGRAARAGCTGGWRHSGRIAGGLCRNFSSGEPQPALRPEPRFEFQFALWPALRPRSVRLGDGCAWHGRSSAMGGIRVLVCGLHQGQLPVCVLPDCGWPRLTAHHSIGVRAAGECWRRFSPRCRRGSVISGAFLTRTDCAGTTASREPMFKRQHPRNRAQEATNDSRRDGRPRPSKPSEARQLPAVTATRKPLYPTRFSSAARNSQKRNVYPLALSFPG